MVTKAKKALLASLAAFLCVMLTVFGLSMSVSLSETAKAADETSAVAQVGTTTYGTLNGAIGAAAEGNTVTLLKDTTEDVVVDKNITLDLGGMTLTGTNSGKATLTIAKGATATVKNGSVIGTSSFYNIQNNGTATFETLTATAGNTGSSMIDNWGTLTINSGTYTGGLNVVKSEEDSTLTINGGQFTLNYSTGDYTGVILTYGDTTITGGEFIQSTDLNWHYPQVVLTGVVEGHTAITRVTGGSFINKSSSSTCKIFHGYTPATSDNFEVSGGTFNKSVPDSYFADGFIPTKNADGTYGVKGPYVAKVGGNGYETLDAAFAALKSTSYKLTLLDENVWDASTPVYWKVDSKTGYTKTLAEALTAVYMANDGKATCEIVCRPGADVGTLTHGHVADSINIFGNNAYISGGECDLEVDTFMYSRETGKQVKEGGVYLDKDITINAYELDNLGVWGQRTTNHKVTVKLTDCDGKEIAGKDNVQRVYISGTAGVNNLTIKKCNFLTKATSIYSNADGNIVVDSCTFKDTQVPLNINHKADGAVTLKVTNSTFTSCGDAGSWAQFAAPARFVNSGSGTMTVTAKTLKFNGTVGSNGDILLGDGREGQKSNDVTLKVTNTAANIQAQKPGYYNADGTTNETKVGKEAITSSSTVYTTSIEDLAPEKGSEKNPYTLEELGAMTRAEYIAAQEKLGGTMYVTVGDYSYDKNGVLGNGVRNDTPGQVPDHSELNAYGENGYLGAMNDGANGKNIVFVGGSITSGVTGYASIDKIGTSLLLAVPAYTNVTFKGTAFKNVMSFDYQLYTSPWSQLGELKFDGCTFNGLIVGAIASQTLTFNKCTFTDYTNTVSANSSNPTWIRPAYGNWTKGDNEGQGGDFKSLTTINFTGNTVTSTRPVKFERIAQWEMTTTVTATNNEFTISAQDGDTSTKNVGLYLGANAKFDLKVENNTKLGSTAALYTAVYSAPSGAKYAGLPAGSTVTDTNGNGVTVEDAYEWKTSTKLTLETTTEVAEVNGVKFATLAEAIAAAKDGETVKLLADVEQNSEVSINKNITLDLNGKKIYNTKDIWHDTDPVIVSLIAIRGGAEVTVMGDGTIAAKANDCYTFNIVDGDLTIENGTFIGNISVVQVQKGRLTINGGTFSLIQKMTDGKGEDRYLINCIDAAFVANDAKVAICGGSFAGFDPNVSPEKKVDGKVPSFAAPGVGITKNEDGSFTAKANMAAQILDSDGNSVKAFATLEEAVNAAVAGQTVMLLTSVDGNFVIEAGKDFTLDLNGYTINGGTGTDKAAITNYGTLTITDSSAAKTGTIKRDDSGIVGETSYYVIQNRGTMTIEQANVVNNSGYRKANPSGSMIGSSLICNGDNDEGATLTIKGGKLTQLNFLAIKNGANGTLFVNGGEITSNHSAVQNWFKAELTGGTIKGQLWTDAYKAGESVGNTKIGGNVQFEGEIVMDVWGSISPKPELTINGGKLSVTNWRITSACAELGGKPAVSGGTFTNAVPAEYCAEGFIPQDNGDGTFGVKVGTYVAKIGEAGYETLAEAIAAAKDGEAVKLLADIDLDEQIATGKAITIDGQGKYTIKAAKKLVGTDGKAGMFYRIQSAKGTLTFLNVTLDGNGVSKIFLNEGGAGETVFDGVTSVNGGGMAYGSGIHISGGGSHATIKNSTLTGSTGTMELTKANYYAANDLWVGGNVYVTVENSTIGTVFVNSAPSATATNGVVHGQLTITGENTKITYLSGEEESAEKVDKFGNNGSLVKIDSGSVDTIFDMGSYAISGGTFKTEIKPEYCADGFIPTQNEDGTYGVTAGSGFVGANVVVTESLAMKLVVGTASKYVVVTYKGLDGIAKTVKLDKFTNVRIGDQDYLSCLFDKIMPQMIDVKFSFELYGENDVMLDRKANYSVVDYLANIIASEKDSAEFRNVAASLIEYANRAKVVKGLATIAPEFVKGTEKVDLTELYKTFIADEKNKIPAKDTVKAEDISKGDAQVIYKAKVVFDDAYTLKFYTNAGDGYTYTLSKNGSTEEEKGITFDKNGEFTINVLAQDITTQYVIKVYGEDTTKPIQTVTYGVSTYCIRMQETKTPQGELYVASYYYGVAVQQYGAANTASVQV